jgi:fucose 4-O-acetylase-like acetyltransferase
LKREDRIDVLRGIGLLCIILAHVGPPGILFQMRNFDVPLMVLVAGSAFVISTQNRPKPGYIEYVKTRFVRLLIPTWIFLITFFVFTLIASLTMHKPYPFSSHTIISSFLLSSGIGYVWVIRVFILVSLIAPFVLIYDKFPDNTQKKAFITVFIVYVLYEILLRYIPNSDQPFINVMLNDILYTAIPYGCIFFLGTRLYAMSGKSMLATSMIFLFLFAAYAFLLYKLNGHIIPTQKFKYPPTAYYISYAMFASIGLYWLSQTNIYPHIPGKDYMAFLGRSSMWIYLWHILILYLISWSHISINFVLKYLVVLGAAVLIAMAQMILLKKVLISINSQEKGKFLKAVFSG